MQQNQWDAAAKRWAILRRAYPQEIATWVKAALCHQRAKQIDAAEELLQDQKRPWYIKHSQRLNLQ
jgi:Tfp pilus assembly protein PilF